MADEKVATLRTDSRAARLEHEAAAVRQLHQAGLRAMKEQLSPRVAAAEAAAAAALAVLQHWTSWAALTAMADSAKHATPGSQEQMQLHAEMAHEALATGTENVRTMWQAWEQLDAAVITWSQLAGLTRDAV